MAPLSPWAWAGIFLIALTAVLGIWFLWTRRAPTALDGPAARAAIRNKDIHAVVDVRGDDEWATGHLSSAIHIPLPTLTAALPHRIPDRSMSILFYCRTGRRARHAAAIAQDLGYSDVYYLDDGDYRDLIHRVKILNV
jgi:phage shock protein E